MDCIFPRARWTTKGHEFGRPLQCGVVPWVMHLYENAVPNRNFTSFLVRSISDSWFMFLFVVWVILPWHLAFFLCVTSVKSESLCVFFFSGNGTWKVWKAQVLGSQEAFKLYILALQKRPTSPGWCRWESREELDININWSFEPTGGWLTAKQTFNWGNLMKLDDSQAWIIARSGCSFGFSHFCGGL